MAKSLQVRGQRSLLPHSTTKLWNVGGSVAPSRCSLRMMYTFTCEQAGSTFSTDLSKDKELTQQFVLMSHKHICAMSLDAAQKPLSSGFNRKNNIFCLIVCFSWSASGQTLCH